MKKTRYTDEKSEAGLNRRRVGGSLQISVGRGDNACNRWRSSITPSDCPLSKAQLTDYWSHLLSERDFSFGSDTSLKYLCPASTRSPADTRFRANPLRCA